MTQPPSIDQLILLPEDAAVRAHFDARNCQTLFRLLVFFTLAAVALALVMGFRETYAALIVPAINLAAIRGLYLVRELPVFTHHFRGFLLAYLVLQALLWKAVYFDPAAPIHPADFAASAVVVFFRLPAGLVAVPLAAVWTLSVGRNLVIAAATSTPLSYPLLVFQTALTLVVFAVVVNVTRRQRRELLIRWRRELHRHREQRRMREELDDARRIQLSMLPASEPRIPWLDVAGISIPASEVGGDYYDYFTISAESQVIVVGDVAGHGVASGLVLSGVRSCLHLLQETPLEPAEILAKIDRMLRQTTGHRAFMTLLYARFDHDERAVTFAAAGHPPPLVRHATSGEVEELVSEALPLGTRLGSSPEQRSVPFAPGDIFLFFTDGIAETLNARRDLFGDERLRKRLRAVSGDRSAREIRDTLLGDVWSFKADGEQLDDVTVVVAKVR